MTRATYVYRLDITYPEVPAGIYWEPPAWQAICDERGWLDGVSGEIRPFTWPAERRFLGKTNAERRKALLERLGAKVTVVRSAPVTWPEVTS